MVTKQRLKKASKLKLIGQTGVGVDNVAMVAVSLSGFVVLNTPFYDSITTAENHI